MDNVAKSNLECSDEKVSWVPLVTNLLERHSDITPLNLYEKIRMIVELHTLLPKILKLTDDLTTSIKYTENLSQSFPAVTETNSNDEIGRRYYPKRIVNLICSLDRCDVSTVRLRPGGVMECLLCGKLMSEEDTITIRTHICGSKHLAKVFEEYTNLVKFHKFWNQQTPETWKKHIQFNYASDHLKCVMCQSSVEYGDVADHLVTCLDNLLYKNSNIGTKKGKEKSKKHAKHLPTQLFRQVQVVEVGGDSYPIFQRLPAGQYSKSFICMICNETVPSIEKRNSHAKSASHVQQQGERTVLESLAIYHRVWKVLPSHMQLLQTHFVRGLEGMTCKICPDTFVHYDAQSLREHLLGNVHPSRSEIRIKLKGSWHNVAKLSAG